ncbi:hypothetical protein M378DRAFT_17101 [Amanita muscaria Koide BX008]|uniref:Uncharacterized protein n=1 Tax=Amanita muscaria (strain Koide BX008) TaxID=946122 RepID=A0A0C2WJS4_AMAMK|nr:hypothetical protein M378DRAFT_17101 [Amanita muscaria Koide BX008]
MTLSGFNVVKPAHTAAATADVPPIPFVPLVFILAIPIAVAAPPAAAPAPGLDDDAVEVDPDPELAFGSWDPTTVEVVVPPDAAGTTNRTDDVIGYKSQWC